MTTTDDEGDDRPEKRPAATEAAKRIAQMSSWIGRIGPDTHEDAGRETMKRLLEASAAFHTDQQVVQAAGAVNNVFIGHASGEVHSAAKATEDTETASADAPSLAERRLQFHFDVLKIKMNHAQWMFYISVIAMIVGLAATVVGVVLAFMNAHSSHGYVTGATGLAASLGGGVLGRHAKRSMDNLNDAAKRNEDKVDADYELEAATTFIDRVEDKDLKDRLNSAAALKALNIHPNPDTMFNNLLPGDSPKEIEPGESTN
ncbi:hypothetical protein [Streptomyces sp. NPDC087856]|uniref:TRADD-N-associated membrane domain-containing protein n=1 Tax=Streptomyces sp. NPDC087856 TaxID=3365811 RepID=UPI003800D533